MTKDELINLGKRHIIDELRTQLGKKKYRFLIPEFEERLNGNTNVSFYARNIFWDNDNATIKDVGGNLPINYYIPLKLDGNLIFNQWSDQKREEIEHSFDLKINMWFSFDDKHPGFSYDIHDKTKSTLYSYNSCIEKFLEEKELQALFQMEKQFDGKNSILFFTGIIRHQGNIPEPFQAFEAHDDIAMCHQDITFTLGELYLYKPFIRDFTEHSSLAGNQPIFHYFPSFTDKRYLSTCSYLFELFYNYWDKIGDMLAPYIAPHLTERNIYFTRVIDQAFGNLTKNKYYLWLKNFRDNQYKELNNTRKQVVHYKSIENQTFQDYHNNFSDFEKLKEKQEKKEAYTDYFKSHYDLSVEGFYNALKLIESTYL
jgi:hypothetical protein